MHVFRRSSSRADVQGSRMPKRRSGDRDGFRASKRRRRHLYLVFDDWLWGYSIRKVNLSSSPSPSGSSNPNDGDGDGVDSPNNAFPAEHLMPPAVFRVEAQRGFPQHFTAAASGSKIIAVLSMRNGFEYRPSAPSASIPVFDLRRRAFTLGPRPEVDLVTPIFIPPGGRVFALSADSFQFQVLEPGSGRCGREGQWRKLQMHPSFKREFSVSSYALHPDGRTIFVSTASGGTFTFDTAAAGDSNWTEHGRWKLPFAGRAHFDPDLDVWIGFSRRKRTKGHLCACDAPRPDDGGERRPGWKVGKEKLFSEDPAEKHVGATLVCMEGQSEFCLVQCVSREDGCPPGDPLNVCRPCRYVCRLTTFSVRLGEEDGLPTVGDSRRVRCYKVPETTSGFTLGQPVAFWM
ncbi:unnamed protein product [Urochloa decumbens]|uniref:Uncharacterized protein n=1 Tax=Urochloa decumbens TaxID=240449 RepID=A0ABC8YHJ5_9POAL